MNAKRRVSILKVLRFLLTVAGVTGCVIAVTSAARRQEKEKLRGVNLVITNASQVQFINPESLRQMLFERRHLNPLEMPLGSADINRFERIARSNPWIEDAEVFVDNRRVLQVRATQRVPVVRLFETTGASYYLDTAFQQLPLSLDYTHYTPVVTGVPPLANASTGKNLKGEIVGLIRAIDADSFWKHGVEEIAMNADGDFELIPVLGNHRVLLGDTSRMAEKLHNVFLFYKNVMNKVGWDRYTLLDVRYAGQVVAAPALPWKAPVDRALSNMNWVKTIVNEDAVSTSAGGNAAAPNPAVSATVQTPATAAQVVRPKSVVPSETQPKTSPAAKAAAKVAATPKSFPQKPSSAKEKSQRSTESGGGATPSQNSKKDPPKAVFPGAPAQP